MRIYSTNEQDRLKEVQDLYSRARLQVNGKHDDFAHYDAQYRGVGEIDGYITSQDDEILGNSRRTPCVWNISHKLLEGSIDTNIPQPLITPALKCAHNIRNARRIESLIKLIMDKQPWEIYNDSQERTVKKFGTSASNIEWDVESGTYTTVGDVQMTPLRPHNVYPQPGVKDIDDADYVFVTYVTTKYELMRKYGLSEEDVEDTTLEMEYDRDSGEHPTNEEDVVTLFVFWYYNEVGDVCRFVYSGDLVLEDDDDYYSRRVEYCKTCGRRRQVCEKDECSNPDYYVNKMDYDELEEDIICSDGRVIPAMSPVFKDGKMQFEKKRMPVTAPDGSQALENVGGIDVPAFMEIMVPKMEKTKLPYYKPKKIPVAIRYNIRDDDSFWGISDMEILKGPQQEANKLYSRIQEANMKYGAALILPENAELEASNGVFDDVIRLKQSMSKDQFGVFSYSVDISPWVAMLERIIELGSDLSGVSDTYLGQADNTAKSGYAKSIQVAQSSGRLASRKMNKHAHFADIFRSIFELYLAFADEPRAIFHEDSECATAAGERFNRYDFYEFDPKTGRWYIDDDYAFSVDPNGALEQQYIQLWEVVKADYAAGLYGNVMEIDTQIMAWQHLERLRYPFARNVVEALKLKREQLALMQQQQAQIAAQSGVPVQGGMPASNVTTEAMTQTVGAPAAAQI